MNTINNPLVLKFHAGKVQYVVNKPLDQSGEYVDKALAEEMLSKLESFQLHIVKNHGNGWKQEFIDELETLISKAKGE